MRLYKGLGTCRIVLVTRPEDWTRVSGQVRRDLALLPLLGLDCEWVSRGKHQAPLALLQIATISGLCVLVRSGFTLDSRLGLS